MKFRSKYDFLSVFTHIVLLGGGAGLYYLCFRQIQQTSFNLLTLLYLLVGSLLIIYVGSAIVSTYYEVREETFFVKYGLMKSEIPFKTIMKVESSRKYLTLNCFSLKKYLITFRQGNDMQKIYVSPRNDDEFIKQLKIKCKSAKFVK